MFHSNNNKNRKSTLQLAFWLYSLSFDHPPALPPNPKRTRSVRPRHDDVIQGRFRIQAKSLRNLLNALGAEVALSVEVDALPLPPTLLEPQLTRHRQSVRELRLACAKLPVGLRDRARLHAPAQDSIKRLWINEVRGREEGREGENEQTNKKELD